MSTSSVVCSTHIPVVYCKHETSEVTCLVARRHIGVKLRLMVLQWRIQDFLNGGAMVVGKRYMARVRRFSKYIQVHSSTSKYIQVQCTWLQVHPSTVYFKYIQVQCTWLQVHPSTVYLASSTSKYIQVHPSTVYLASSTSKYILVPCT